MLAHPEGSRICAHPGCGRKRRSCLLCEFHRYRKSHGLDMDAPHRSAQPGLARMMAGREFPWECVACGEAVPPKRSSSTGKLRIVHGEPVCLAAYRKLWRRDARRGLYRRKRT